MEKTASILVTGGSGMVGRSLLARLRLDGFMRISSPSSKQFDLRREDAAHCMFAEQPADYVFHLAGHVGGIGASIADPVGFLYDNALIGMHVVQAARAARVKKLVFLSSSCTYPRDCAQPMKEEDILTGLLEPTNEGYAIAKIAAMKLIEYSNRQYGTNFLSLMPCNLYGLYDHYEPERSHAVSALIYKFHNAKQKNLPSVEVWGTGASRRELLFVDDLADAMLYFMRNVDAKDVPTFVNVGLGQDISIHDLAHTLRDIVGYSGDIVFNHSKPDGMPRKMMDVSRAAKLGWKAQVGIPEGLRRAYDWYRVIGAADAGVAVNDNLKVTLLLPTLNEIEAVTVIVPQIRKEWADEFICIDGGSTDGTVDFMKQHGFRVHSQSGRGFGQGMLQGMQIATGDIVVEFMPDGNSVPADIPRIIAKMREGYDLAIASRYAEGAKSEDDDWLTGVGNWLFTTIVNVLFWTRYTDVLTGFRAYRRNKMLTLNMDTPGLSWPAQSCMRAARAGLKTIDVPADEPARIGGQRKMKPFKTGMEISKLILRDFLTYRPAKP